MMSAPKRARSEAVRHRCLDFSPLQLHLSLDLCSLKLRNRTAVPITGFYYSLSGVLPYYDSSSLDGTASSIAPLFSSHLRRIVQSHGPKLAPISTESCKQSPIGRPISAFDAEHLAIAHG